VVAEKKQFEVMVLDERCKRCGICIAFCPTKVFVPDAEGKPIVAAVDKCIGCRLCELRCPDIAVKVGAK
jgi:2-oxoglutarate ferredoxin oxidoreductase subunit delta